MHTILAITVFLGIIIFSAFEKVHRTVAAMTGAGLLLIFGVMTQEDAIQYIDFNTLGLILGMMFLLGIAKRSGIFHYIAIRTVKFSKADPVRLLFSFTLLSGIMAAFMDAVTAVILLAPIVFLICSMLEVESFPYLFAIGLAVNIGGTATMIGDPPNVMIGSAVGLTFIDFIKNTAPISMLILVAFAFSVKHIFGSHTYGNEKMKSYLMSLDESRAITNPILAKKSVGIMALVIISFIFHGYIHLKVATIAIAGAAILLFITKIKPDEIFEESDFLTIFFFIGLFISVGALEKTGVIDFLSKEIFHLTEGHPALLALTILWFSAIVSAFVDNIPLVACLIPLIKNLPEGAFNQMPLWYALSLGACMGGNGTLIGASSNLVVAGISEKYGEKITFAKFTRYGMPVMLASLVISSLYLYLRYFL